MATPITFCQREFTHCRKNTTHDVELRPIILRLILACGDLDIIYKFVATLFSEDRIKCY